MSRFSVGDRVMVYGIVHEQACFVRTGAIERIISGVSTANGFDRVWVDLDEPITGKPNPVIVYLRQCRKLKPKKKRRVIWISPGAECLHVENFTDARSSSIKVPGWPKFREVKQ